MICRAVLLRAFAVALNVASASSSNSSHPGPIWVRRRRWVWSAAYFIGAFALVVIVRGGDIPWILVPMVVVAIWEAWRMRVIVHEDVVEVWSMHRKRRIRTEDVVALRVQPVTGRTLIFERGKRFGAICPFGSGPDAERLSELLDVPLEVARE